LPSPVFISAILPVQHHAAHQLHVVVAHLERALAASRQTANASARMSSRVAPLSSFSLNSAVLA
jgi:hypothetical protein